MHEAETDNISAIDTPWERRVAMSNELGRVVQALYEESQRPLGPQTPHGPADSDASTRRVALEVRFNELTVAISAINRHVPRHPKWIPNGNDSPWREVAHEPAPLHTLPEIAPELEPSMSPTQPECLLDTEQAIGL